MADYFYCCLLTIGHYRLRPNNDKKNKRTQQPRCLPSHKRAQALITQIFLTLGCETLRARVRTHPQTPETRQPKINHFFYNPWTLGHNRLRPDITSTALGQTQETDQIFHPISMPKLQTNLPGTVPSKLEALNLSSTLPRPISLGTQQQPILSNLSGAQPQRKHHGTNETHGVINNENFWPLCEAQYNEHAIPRTQFTHSTPPHPHASKTSTQNFRNSYWHSYPKRNLHTARRQTRMPGTHQRKIFAAPIGPATPNAIYTQPAAKPACQEHISAKFSQLPLAQLPQTQFTHSTPPNPHASRTWTQNFRNSDWRSYPQHNLHTARRQTRMPGTHQRKIFAAPIGTVTHSTAAKPECKLVLAQLPRTKFTHSNPKKHQRPAHDLHTARRQSHRPGRHQRKIKSHSSYCHSYPKHKLHIDPHARNTSTQKKVSQLLLAQLPRTQFTHSTPPNPHASKTSTQNFHTSS